MGRGSPTPPSACSALPLETPPQLSALGGEPLTQRAPVWEEDSLRRKANPCPSGFNPPSGNARFPGQASRRSEIPVLPGRSQGLSDCLTPTSPVTAGKLRPRGGGVPSAMGSPPQTTAGASLAGMGQVSSRDPLRLWPWPWSPDPLQTRGAAPACWPGHTGALAVVSALGVKLCP